MGLGKWIARKAEDFVIGPEERLNQEAEQLANGNAPKNPKTPKDGRKK